MSIKRMTAVWEHSAHKGSDLLLLLALADSANDNGYCWPSIEVLIQKTRLSESTVIRRTTVLEESGELYCDHNRRYGNKYLVVVGMDEPTVKAHLAHYFSWTEEALTGKLPVKANLQNDSSEPSKLDSSELAKLDSSELSPVTDDPSYNRQLTARITIILALARQLEAFDPFTLDPSRYSCAQLERILDVLAGADYLPHTLANLYQDLLDKERAGKNRQSNVVPMLVTRLREFYTMQALERFEWVDMVDATSAALGVSLTDPGMAGRVGEFIKQHLWNGPNPYAPLEIITFVDEQDRRDPGGDWHRYCTFGTLPEKLSKYRTWKTRYEKGNHYESQTDEGGGGLTTTEGPGTPDDLDDLAAFVADRTRTETG